jgi:O-antigen/teichoic acid export membrane protein
LNIFYGVTVNAAMGIANQVNSAVNQFVTNFQTAFVPQITKLYSMGNLEELKSLIYRSSRFSFFLLFALACPLILNIDFILVLWLKNVPEYSSVFCVLTLINSLIETMSKPLGFGIHATGKVKYYNIAMSIALFLNVVFSFVFLKMGFAPSIVFFVSVFITIICFVIRLLFVKHFKIVSIRDYASNVVLKSFYVAVISLPLPLYLRGYYERWIGLFVSSMIFFIFFLSAIYFIGLTKSEKESLLKLVTKKTMYITKD